MSNGAPSADAKSGDGRASDGGRDRAMSRGWMSCDGAMSVGKVSNGRTMTGGKTSGAATTTLGAEVASSDGTLSHNGPLSHGATSHGEASNGRIMTGGMTSGAATTIGAEASTSATGTIGAMTGANAARGSHSTAGRRDARMRNERPSFSRSAAYGQLNAKQLSSHISNAGSADALLALSAAHSTSLDHIHAANLWNKLGKQRIERRHEERLEQLAAATPEHPSYLAG
ncbi:hypothetical protein EMIHUDRAFT_225876 [Emiliania huxleyi CCMP1516]|uniref:Uncharacterized protein n=2 Tax=Emiliania huxleyi TaxID=2903 RepID=A0A0D3KN38_EMIH1|nr:hypothetical protein EMIHUDRAFT_225876 [Emiliania huxleyi CCMP1516]EOD37173.1 hypothetical protein EMIHUDRAFT_225876 [Emiliania huxleyi CCMP1516]|eukprot:XP_005789602.1 hypothetical protein EMIHUDRAFT_225876 [Emiliania huxleyi CCMP1516]